MNSFAELCDAFVSEEDGKFSMDAPENWAQGRTLYGGLSAALCQLVSASVAETDQPMKSALLCFVGPAAGHLTGKADVLRRGRSTVVTDAILTTEKGVGTRAVFVYGADRESRLQTSLLNMPSVPSPEESENFFRKGGPAFASNFEVRIVGGFAPVSGADRGEMLVWCRHKTPVGSDQAAALLALADVLPPASFTMFKEPAPISTITWSVEFLQSDVDVSDNWFLFQSTAEHTQNGYSSQAMYLWDQSGRPVLAARQNVTIFY